MTSSVHYFVYFNVQVNQWFFAFCFLTHQLNLTSFNSNCKAIGSNLFSVLRPVKSLFLNLLIPLTSKSINHSFLGALILLNILDEPYLVYFNLYRSLSDVKCDATVYHKKLPDVFVFSFLISTLITETQLQSFLPLNTSDFLCLVSVLQHLKCFFRAFLDFF